MLQKILPYVYHAWTTPKLLLTPLDYIVGLLGVFAVLGIGFVLYFPIWCLLDARAQKQKARMRKAQGFGPVHYPGGERALRRTHSQNRK